MNQKKKSKWVSLPKNIAFSTEEVVFFRSENLFSWTKPHPLRRWAVLPIFVSAGLKTTKWLKNAQKI